MANRFRVGGGFVYRSPDWAPEGDHDAHRSTQGGRKDRPPRRTLATAISMACCMKELDIRRAGALNFRLMPARMAFGPAWRLRVDAELFEDPAFGGNRLSL